MAIKTKKELETDLIRIKSQVSAYTRIVQNLTYELKILQKNQEIIELKIKNL